MAKSLSRLTGYIAGGLGLVLLSASALWWYGESKWGGYHSLTPQQAFTDGSFGLELAPLRYILVADKVSATALREKNGPPWPQRFGFLPRGKKGLTPCVADAPDNLPVGFTVSNRLPGNATPVPVKFVGLSCAACHSSAFSAGGTPVIGPGTTSADVIAFSDAFLNAVLDTGSGKQDGLTAKKILDTYEQQCKHEFDGLSGTVNRWVEAFFIDQWLSGFRSVSRENITKYDLPYHGGEIGDFKNIPTGPSRTRPFRSVVRNTLDFPGATNRAYSKVPAAILQGDKSWSQFDGSIGDPTIRSMIAVFTSGSSIAALDDPQIADNIRKAAAFTLALGNNPPMKTLAETFPGLPTPSTETLTKGKEMYMHYCNGCHGHPEDKQWVMPPSQSNPPITPISEIGTDPARIKFRYSEMLPLAISATLPQPDITPQIEAMHESLITAQQAGALAGADWWQQAIDRLKERSREFPAGHRMTFKIGEVVRRNGFQNSPLPFMWLRAPYLHNGSVLSLSALIGLQPRLERFCRGTKPDYDTKAIGLPSVEPGTDGCSPDFPFLFDTTLPGNSAAGHEYPKKGSVSRADLENLLAYLGTI